MPRSSAMRANSTISLIIACQRSLMAAIGRRRSRSSNVPGTVGSNRSPNLIFRLLARPRAELCCLQITPPDAESPVALSHSPILAARRTCASRGRPGPLSLEIRNHVLTPELDRVHYFLMWDVPDLHEAQ